MKIRYITRTISNISAVVMCADPNNATFIQKEITLGSDIINWKKYKAGEISEKSVENIILSNAIGILADEEVVPVKVINWEKVSGLYRLSEDIFLANAEKVDIDDIDETEDTDE